MSPDGLGAALLARIGGAFERVQNHCEHLLLSLNSTFSVVSLLSALLLAVVVIAGGRLRRRGRISPKLLAKALRPQPAVLGPSGKADLGFFLLNCFCTSGLIGWALLSQNQVSNWTLRALEHAFGPAAVRPSGAADALATTVAMFLAYELAYWFDHWLSHRIPWLWEIHKVHHTAEGLSPFTNFRVHPLESLKFYNIVAVATGIVFGLQSYHLGYPPSRLEVLHADVLFLAFILTIGHLQHSHVWISFPGVWGRLLMSPAHHQVHHSADPRHFGRNLGSGLAIWDLVFGTLYVPAARREPLSFGVSGETAAAHSVTGSLITPMVRAAQVLVRSCRRAGTPVATQRAELSRAA